MKILTLESNVSEDINKEDLLNYLNQVVSYMTDDDIEKHRLILDNLKSKITQQKQAYKDIKETHEFLTSEYAKENQLKRVLTRIEALRKEGTIRGQHKNQIIKILPKLKTYNFSSLTKLEERLSIL